ncbi:hypothetical protein VF21_07741 [Pseudogymnoascus sp. 05NY08]|nr:hypothetical protein VF21_07741 [Pseudogymnoascus sp. 05NY08]
MAGKKNFGENGKKVSGNAQKAEAAAAKAAAANQVQAKAEDEDWGRGAKNSSKKEAEAAKKLELARKKAEKEALLAEEEKSLKSAPKSSKAAPKKVSRGLDLAQLDDAPSGPAKALNATGIDNALDALTLTSGDSSKVEKHPERRYKAAYAAYEERRLAEMEEDGSGAGLRQNQKKERIRKEFEKSPENPFNNVSVAYDATKEEIAAIREGEKKKIEDRLGK